jgi:hypothetical protein
VDFSWADYQHKINLHFGFARRLAAATMLLAIAGLSFWNSFWDLPAPPDSGILSLRFYGNL